MARAVELAGQGRFRVEPNPCVGCVIVKRGQIIAEGYHAFFGGPHAEAAALRAAGKRARKSTVYVSLEPCAHRGKQPSCADALIRAGVAEVVYASPDPYPGTAGVGPARLRAAGIRVRRRRPTAAARRLLDPYLGLLGRKRPWMIAKWAMTLDGRIAARGGDSRWISSDTARRWAQRHLRATVDAILVGAGTVRADDPQLTNRARRGKQPLRIVLCGKQPLPPRARLLTEGGPTLLAIPDGFRAPRGAATLPCGRHGRVQVRRLLPKLFARGLRRILVEGGGEIHGSLFDAGLIDQACVFVAPRIIGGTSARPALAGRGRAPMQAAAPLHSAVHRQLGPDHVIEGYLA